LIRRAPLISSERDIPVGQEQAGDGRLADLTAVRVLLAEPDQALREDYAQYLTAHGAVIAVAAGGVECIEQLRAFQPHVLVLEPELQWGGGAGVIEWMLSDPEVPTTPVIAVTQGRDLDLLRRILKFPLYDLVMKPLAPRHLAEKIRWVVDFVPTLGKVGWPR
jgi:DNA-binding response OmpR family regulator